MNLPGRAFARLSARGGHAQLDAYLDGELSSADTARFEGHLAGCGRCRAAVAAHERLGELFTALPIVDSSRSLHLTPEMVAAAPAGAVARPAPRPTGALRFAQAIAALALLGLVGSVTADLSGGGSTPAPLPAPTATAAPGAGDTRTIPTPGTPPASVAGGRQATPTG